MIKEFEFYHGTVFTKLLHGGGLACTISRYPTPDNAAYVVDHRVGIYIKYSTKRMSPWRFSFQRRHQEEIQEMKYNLGNVFLLLVCNDDGIVTLSFDELKRILDETHEEVEWISVARNKRQMYSVAGSDGRLGFKIGKDDFPSKIFGQSTASAAQAATAGE
jgi:hypothetical protein